MQLAPSPRPKQAYFPGLGGLRGLASLWVFILHALTWNFPNFVNGSHWYGRLVLRGYLSVDLFFVLSGFLLCSLYQKTFEPSASLPSVLEFLSRRLARIWPTLIISSAVCFALAFAGNTHPSLIPFGIDVLFLSSVPGLLGINGPVWSISAEMLAYIALPFAIRLTFLMPKCWSLLALLGTLAAAVLIIRNGNLDNHTFLRAVPGFCAGMLTTRFTQPPSKRLILFSVLGFIATLLLPMPLAIADIAAIPAFMILVRGVSSGFAAHFLDSRPLVWLGDASYSFYLFHPFMFTIVGGALLGIGMQNPFAWIAIVGAATLIIATISFHFIETPMRKLWRIYYRILSFGKYK